MVCGGGIVLGLRGGIAVGGRGQRRRLGTSPTAIPSRLALICPMSARWSQSLVRNNLSATDTPKTSLLPPPQNGLLQLEDWFFNSAQGLPPVSPAGPPGYGYGFPFAEVASGPTLPQVTGPRCHAPPSPQCLPPAPRDDTGYVGRGGTGAAQYDRLCDPPLFPPHSSLPYHPPPLTSSFRAGRRTSELRITPCAPCAVLYSAPIVLRRVVVLYFVAVLIGCVLALAIRCHNRFTSSGPPVPVRHVAAQLHRPLAFRGRTHRHHRGQARGTRTRPTTSFWSISHVALGRVPPPHAPCGILFFFFSSWWPCRWDGMLIGACDPTL